MGTPCPSARAERKKDEAKEESGRKNAKKNADRDANSTSGRTARRHRQQTERLRIDRIGSDKNAAAASARLHDQRKQRPAPLSRASQSPIHEAGSGARKRRETVNADFDESRLRTAPCRESKATRRGQGAGRRQGRPDATQPRRERCKKRQRGNGNTCKQQGLHHPGRTQGDTRHTRRMHAPRSRKRVAAGRRRLLRRRGRGVALGDHVRAAKP